MIELLLHAERALSVGMLDRAETLYRQVAAADPRNSIAYVGLSRVALDRGDELEALELARQGLALDPENNAALRMVQRLEEIIDYRLEVEGPIMPARPDDDEALGTAAEAELATVEPDVTMEAEPDQSEAEPTTETPGEEEAAPSIEVERDVEAPSEAEAAVDAVIAGWAVEPDTEPDAATEGQAPFAADEPYEPQPEASPDPWPNPSPPPWAATDPQPTTDVAGGGATIDPWPEATPDLVEPAGASSVAAPPPAAYEDDAPRRSWFDRLFRRER